MRSTELSCNKVSKKKLNVNKECTDERGVGVY